MVRRSTIAIAAVTIWLQPVTAQNPVPYSGIYSAYKTSVLKVVATGELYNREREVSSGSGFVFRSDGLALTSNHVVFANTDNYKTITIEVFVGPQREATRLPASVIAVDRARDIAVLRIDSTRPLPPVAMGQSSTVSIGDELSVMGFPLNYDLSIVRGLLSSVVDDAKWQTDAALNRGNSGGPVFDRFGKVVGVASGGAVLADNLPVEGIKFFIPTDAFQPVVAEAFQLVGVPPPPPPPPLPPRGGPGRNPASIPPLVAETPRVPDPRTVELSAALSRSFTLSEVQATHGILMPTPLPYVRTFDAEEGYRITDANLLDMSANNVSPREVRIIDDGRRVQVAFIMTSGPLWSQYRSWDDATLVTQQVRR